MLNTECAFDSSTGQFINKKVTSAFRAHIFIDLSVGSNTGLEHISFLHEYMMIQISSIKRHPKRLLSRDGDVCGFLFFFFFPHFFELVFFIDHRCEKFLRKR